MCEFFVSADPMLYESRRRSVRIHGVITSIRLEHLMWDVLAQIAIEQRCTTNALIATLHDEVMARRGEAPNFTSFLRVTCVRHLMRMRMRHAEEEDPEPPLADRGGDVTLRH